MNETATEAAHDAVAHARQAKYLAKDEEFRELAKAVESIAKALERLTQER
ncbi:hypothetical protein FHX48_002811 [Microbacterium halimionae]|uniref:Uncharacterized protein n=1 Tax=Microbacterium halimionae TaxID=1526413 RepID=A0A7W3PN21_9MICO|nr:hypothetical protein [Microbacterium halimionae]MBA8817129.1 hypothetical protein [Microbacterium halimionae]MBA8817706.1 hypothetical protein [Microbacterium halimionae]NII94579.1 hypothetical protein [Microbacterium halimionae]